MCEIFTGQSCYVLSLCLAFRQWCNQEFFFQDQDLNLNTNYQDQVFKILSRQRPRPRPSLVFKTKTNCIMGFRHKNSFARRRMYQSYRKWTATVCTVPIFNSIKKFTETVIQCKSPICGCWIIWFVLSKLITHTNSHFAFKNTVIY